MKFAPVRAFMKMTTALMRICSEDMSRTVLGPSHDIFAATPSDLADLSGESIAHDFEYLSIDGITFDPSSDTENRAPTPPYISPQSVVTDLGHSDPEAE